MLVWEIRSSTAGRGYLRAKTENPKTTIRKPQTRMGPRHRFPNVTADPNNYTSLLNLLNSIKLHLKRYHSPLAKLLMNLVELLSSERGVWSCLSFVVHPDQRVQIHTCICHSQVCRGGKKETKEWTNLTISTWPALEARCNGGSVFCGSPLVNILLTSFDFKRSLTTWIQKKIPFPLEDLTAKCSIYDMMKNLTWKALLTRHSRKSVLNYWKQQYCYNLSF